MPSCLKIEPLMLNNKLAILRINNLMGNVCGDATAASGNFTIPVNVGFVRSSGGTINVHTAIGWKDKQITIKRVGAGTVTVDGASSETIDDALTYGIVQNYDSITIISDNANWWIK